MILSSLISSAPARAAALLMGVSLLASPALATCTDEECQAQITDMNEECTPYYYAPSATQIHNFPTIWQPASILPNDTEAQQAWATIQPQIPTNISVKLGTILGNFSNFTPTYSYTDPDCWWTYHQCVTPKLASLPEDVAGVPEPLTLGYGFDDGPNCSHNAFYDYLTSQNQKATMFYIGSNVMDWPLEAQRAVSDGHEICVHTWSHHYMTAFESEDAFAEFYYTIKAIKLVTGVTPTCWRPPYGDVDDRIRAIANAMGLRTVMWQYDSNDWRVGSGDGTTPAMVDANYEALIQRAENGTFNDAGTIMLTHELNNFTMSEAMKFFPQLRQAFKNMVPVNVALNKTNLYVESNVTGMTFEQYVAKYGYVQNSTNGTSSSSGGSSSSGSGSGSSSSSAKQSGAISTVIPGVAALASLFAGAVAMFS